jgi:TPR repeat protein
VQRDDKKAIDWYVKAANQSNASAQCDLGWMHFYGYGVPKDPSRAVDWYTKAALQGHAISASNLGLSYKDGTGTCVVCVVCAAAADRLAAGLTSLWVGVRRRRGQGLREGVPLVPAGR